MKNSLFNNLNDTDIAIPVSSEILSDRSLDYKLYFAFLSAFNSVKFYSDNSCYLFDEIMEDNKTEIMDTLGYTRATFLKHLKAFFFNKFKLIKPEMISYCEFFKDDKKLAYYLANFEENYFFNNHCVSININTLNRLLKNHDSKEIKLYLLLFEMQENYKTVISLEYLCRKLGYKFTYKSKVSTMLKNLERSKLIKLTKERTPIKYVLNGNIEIKSKLTRVCEFNI